MSEGNETPANFTRAGVTGKVPHIAKGGRKLRKGRKLSGSRRHHVGQLKKAGVISHTAAAKQGI